jgi:kumamolisin
MEVMLDIFVAGAVAPASKIAVYFGAGGGSPIPGPNWYDPVNTAIHDTVNKPCVLSISWGESEASFGSSNMAAMDSVLAQAAVLGITICVASGDNGSTWDGNGIEVLYPGSSPYVLSCGGTSLSLSGSSIASEVVWNESTTQAGAGGGGISIYETRPSYQNGLTYKTYPAGTVSSLPTRGVPDIAGNADPYSGYSYYYGNPNTQVQGVGGTSSVAPLIAGLIARLCSLTGKRLGLMNTLLYANPSVCNDITSGNNVYVPYGVMEGYSATAGWDACSGLGSPNGAKIFRLINTGTVYPYLNLGARPSTGAVWPRPNQGTRSH